MKGIADENSRDPLADALATYDDRLAVGVTMRPLETEQIVDPALLTEWNRLTAFLSLVEKAWPRGNADLGEPTIIVQDGRGALDEEPARTTAATVALDSRLFGRFEIIRTLGQGGFGIVFLAWDPRLRRLVALKVPQPVTLATPESRKRFQREGHAAAGLDHPNIVPVYECGSVGTIAYIAAAYIPGPTLALWLSRQTAPVPARDAVRLIATLARAVAHAHERGVLHRDLKPTNILLQTASAPTDPDQTQDGPLADFEPRITDFSLAKLADGLGPDTRSGVPFGSPSYMAPEQAEGKLTKIGPPTDIYGLGCVLYELLMGSPPFRGESQFDTLKQVIADEPPPPRRRRRDLPLDLEAVVLKCLEKDPTRRYATARALADDLNRHLAGEATLARPQGRWEKLRHHTWRHPEAIFVLGVAVLFTVAILGGKSWLNLRLNQARQSADRLRREIRDQALATRRAQYVADIRQTPHDIHSYRTHNADELLARHRPLAGQDDLRDFTWSYLHRHGHTERRTLARNHQDFYFVEFSPGGNLLAGTGKHGSVLIWDTSSWQLVREIVAAPTEVNVAAFSRDATKIATVDDDGKLKLWDLATGRCQFERPAHAGDAVVARFTPDGESIVTGGRSDGYLKVWDHKTGQMLDSFRADETGLENAVFSADGSVLATVGVYGVKLWYWPAKRLIRSQNGSHNAQGVAFSHDGTRLATAHEADQSIRVWDTRDGRPVRELRGHTDGVFSIAFSADDRTLISASDDETIRLWDVATGLQSGVHLGHSGRVWNLALAPDGRSIASAGKDGTVKLWDLDPPRDPAKLTMAEPRSFGFSPRDRTLIVSELSPAWALSRWDIASASLIERKPLNLTGTNTTSAFSHDGRILAIANQEATITFCDLETGRRHRAHDPAMGDIQALEFSPNDRYVLVHRVHPDPGSLLWDRAHQRLISFPCDRVYASCWTPSQEILANLGGGKLIRWNPTTRQTKPVSLAPSRNLDFLVTSSDGRRLVSLDVSQRKIRLWSLETWHMEKEIAGHRGGQLRVAISPNGKTLASAGADKKIKLWYVATGEELLALEGPGGPVWDLRFSPNGEALTALGTSALARHGEGEILLWRATDDDPQPARSRAARAAR